MEEQEYRKLYEQELENIVPCTEEETARLLAALFSGEEEARIRLAEGYLHMVWELAREYTTENVGLLDLVQEGNLGLLEAIAAYSEGDFKDHIRRYILRAMEDALDEEMEQNRGEEALLAQINAVQEGVSALTLQLGREPSLEEISAHLGMTQEEVRILLKQALDALTN